MKEMTMEKTLTIQIPGQDKIQVEMKEGKQYLHFQGCHDFTSLMISFKKNFGVNVSQWPLPKGQSHSEMIMRELILKLQGKWQYPYAEEELCHCRHVSRETVDVAILNGAHSTDLASQWTGCSTACGTCKPSVEKMIQYRRGQS